MNFIIDKLNNFNDRLSWNQYFGMIVTVTKLRSSCKRLKVGCLIVKENRIISSGYNGNIPGAPHKSLVKDGHEQLTIHAEINAICHAAKNGINLNNSIAYITHFPCVNCAKSLISSGIKEIIYLEDYKNSEIAKELLISGGIKVNKLIW